MATKDFVLTADHLELVRLREVERVGLRGIGEFIPKWHTPSRNRREYIKAREFLDENPNFDVSVFETATPEPAPEPAPDLKPDPTPEPAPEPQPVPEPEPVVKKPPPKPKKAPQKASKPKKAPIEVKDPDAPEVCSICGGDGVLWIDDFNRERCVCQISKMLAYRLGPELNDAKGPHITPEALKKYGISLTDDLFLKLPWHQARRFLKSALLEAWKAGDDTRFQMISDSEIISTWLSSARRETYSGEEEGAEDSNRFAGLEDLIRPPDLLIIRLGVLQYPNKAASGKFHEVLRIRQTERKPTWVVADPSEPFESGHRCWDPHVDQFLGEHFKVKRFK